MAAQLWQDLGDGKTERMRVPGGWVVRSGTNSAVGMCFVPDHYVQYPNSGAPSLEPWELPGERASRMAPASGGKC